MRGNTKNGDWFDAGRLKPQYSCLSATSRRRMGLGENRSPYGDGPLTPTICSNIPRGLPARPDHPLVASPEVQKRPLAPGARWNWIVEAMLSILSRRPANLLDRHHFRRRVQGIARMPVVQFFLGLPIFFRSLTFLLNYKSE